MTFASSLFGGIQSILEIGHMTNMLKQERMNMDIAKQVSDAIRQNTGNDGKVPKGEYIEPPPGAPTDLTGGLNTTSLLDDPDLKTMQTPNYMKALSGKTKSATAADMLNTVVKPQTTSASAADAPAPMPFDPALDAVQGMDAAPAGALTFSSSKGFHRQTPEEQITSPKPLLGGALNFSSSQGLYNPDSSVGQQIQSQQPAVPTDKAPPTYLPSRRLDSVSNKGNRRLSGMKKGRE